MYRFCHRALLLILVFSLFTNVKSNAQTPVFLGSAQFTASGLGNSGVPSINYDIPGGNNRVMIVQVYIERNHSANNNNWPRDPDGTSFNAVRRVRVEVGNLDITNNGLPFGYVSAFRSTTGDNSTVRLSNHYLAVTLSDADWMPTGPTNITFPELNLPENTGDEMAVVVTVYGNAHPTVIALNPSDASTNSNSFDVGSISLTGTAPSVSAGNTTSNIMYQATGRMSQQGSALGISSGWTERHNLTVNNTNGSAQASTSLYPTENDGIRMAVATRTGLSSNPSVTFTRSSGISNILVAGAHLYAIMPLGRPAISGTVYRDNNGLTGGINAGGTGGGTWNTANSLWVNAVDEDGVIIQSVPVSASNGVFSFPAGGNLIEGAHVSFRLSATQGVAGQLAAAANLPLGWTVVGESTEGGPSDGSPDGEFSMTIVATSSANNTTNRFGVTFQEVSISGTVVNDANNSPTILDNGETGTNAGGLFVYLVDVANTIVGKATVAADGTYSLTASASTTYTLQLSSQDLQNGSSAASLTNQLPGGWVATGEGLNNTDDGTINGIINLTTTTTPTLNANFGIQALPFAGGGDVTLNNPGGSQQVSVPNEAFTNSSPSSDPAPGNVTSIRITGFPSGVASIVIDGTSYTALTWPAPGVVVTADMNGNPDVPITIDPEAEGATTVVIPFVAIDNAGFESEQEGEAIIRFVATYSISGTVYNDNDGPVNGPDGALVNGTPGGLNLVVNLYDAAGSFVASAPVAADGTYTLVGVPAGSGYQVQLTTAANTGSASQNISANPTTLPGTFVHVSNTSGLSPETGVNVVTVSGNVTGSNLGINEPPTAVPNPPAAVPNPGGTTSVVITTNFGGTDPNLGEITSLTITDFPTNTTSITIGGITYTPTGGGGTTEWPGTVTVPTGPTGVPTTGNEISIDPIDGEVTVAIPFTVTDNAGLTSTEATLNVPFTSSMPVTLVSFRAHVSEGVSRLTWATTEETNSDRFEVQHSLDAAKWLSIGAVAASGESSALQSYNFAHKAQAAGLHYYRLKMIDRDGTYAYSGVVSVQLERGMEQLSVYPNPATSVLSLSSKGARAIRAAEVINTTGQVLKLDSQLANGGDLLTLRVGGLPSGVYIVRVYFENGVVETKKVLISGSR